MFRLTVSAPGTSRQHGTAPPTPSHRHARTQRPGTEKSVCLRRHHDPPTAHRHAAGLPKSLVGGTAQGTGWWSHDHRREPPQPDSVGRQENLPPQKVQEATPARKAQADYRQLLIGIKNRIRSCISLNLINFLTLRNKNIFSFPSLNRNFALSLQAE